MTEKNGMCEFPNSPLTTGKAEQKFITVYCDEKDCFEVTTLDLKIVKRINWRCPKHDGKDKEKEVETW